MNELNMTSNQAKQLKKNSRIWWNSRRIQYNKGLFIAGILAFILYIILGNRLIAPHEETFEITFFTVLLKIIGYLFMMLVANVLYELGSIFDVRLNKNENEQFRKNLYQTGFWFSMALVFYIPVNVLFVYFTQYA